MKTTVLTIALALGSMSLMSAKSQTTPPATGDKPVTSAPAKATKKHKKHKKTVKNQAVKTPAAPAAPAK